MARIVLLHYLSPTAPKPKRTACNHAVAITTRTTADLDRVTCTHCRKAIAAAANDGPGGRPDGGGKCQVGRVPGR